MAVPTFFLVGAPKAGTTSLFEYLKQHPDIATSTIKEPCFFAPEVPVSADVAVHRSSWEAYLQLFAHAGAAKAVGEGSVAYLASVNAPAAIRARVPDARILMMLRDPADRLFAHFAAARTSRAWAGTFAAWIAHQQSLEAGRDPVWGPIWAGRYGIHLQRFRQHFPADQLHISYYEDFVNAPAAVMRNIFTFLGVDPGAPIDVSQHYNVTPAPRGLGLPPGWTPVMWAAKRMVPNRMLSVVRSVMPAPVRLHATQADRAIAIDLYRDDIKQLERLTGRDLSGWRE